MSTRISRRIRVGILAIVVVAGGLMYSIPATRRALDHQASAAPPDSADAAPPEQAGSQSQGRQIFRFDTFGNEQFWTDQLGLHDVIEEAVSPEVALSVGLKVDSAALPGDVRQALEAGMVDLTDPQSTLLLIKHDAVVGVSGKVTEQDDGTLNLESVGITCALCHSTVDDSFGPSIGERLDGWPNLDLDPGAIIALSTELPEETRAVYRSWGPGMYDPRFNIDGLSTPLVLPPAYGLADVSLETYTGEGPISYWNNYVAVTQMGGQGTFIDDRLGIHVEHSPDRVQPKLRSLLAYQLGLPTPAPPDGFFDPDAAARGELVFHEVGCAECHVPPLYTDVNLGMLHDAAEVGQDPAYAARTTTGQYRTTPLRGLWQHAPYFHDGSADTLEDVVEHYEEHFGLVLSEDAKADLIEFLRSL